MRSVPNLNVVLMLDLDGDLSVGYKVNAIYLKSDDLEKPSVIISSMLNL